MDGSQNYGASHFTIINETIILYPLNLHSDVCQLFLSKTGKNQLALRIIII